MVQESKAHEAEDKKRRELIDDIELEPADPALYDRFCDHTTEDSHGTT